MNNKQESQTLKYRCGSPPLHKHCTNCFYPKESHKQKGVLEESRTLPLPRKLTPEEVDASIQAITAGGSHEGVEEIIAEVDDFWDKLYLPKTGKGPHKGKKERLKDWLREKLTSLNTKKHE